MSVIFIWIEDDDTGSKSDIIKMIADRNTKAKGPKRPAISDKRLDPNGNKRVSATERDLEYRKILIPCTYIILYKIMRYSNTLTQFFHCFAPYRCICLLHIWKGEAFFCC